MSHAREITISTDYLDGLERKIESYRTLTEISSIISSTLDLNELMELVMEKAKQEMKAEACSILFYNRKNDKLEFEVAFCENEAAGSILKKKISLDMGQGIAGWVAANLKTLVIDDAQSDPRFYKEADKQTGFVTKSLIAVPLVGRCGLIGVAELVNPKNRDYDQELFTLLCRQFAIAIENALLHKESLEKERHRQELEIAAALQKSFLPASPNFRKGNLSIAAVNIPAAKIGGDIYDFIELSTGKVGIFIGDVSGKGVSGALYMAKIMSDFRYIAYQAESPGVALTRLNELLSSAPRGMFLTALYMVADTLTGEVSIASAGHPPFLFMSRNEVIVKDVFAGPPVGIVQAEYPATTLLLTEGDRLFLCTDGVFEAKNREGARIGFSALVVFMQTLSVSSPIIPAVSGYVDEFSAGTERADDLTMVEIHWTKNARVP